MTLSPLLQAHREGHALAQAFYTAPDVFARDMDLLLGRWTCAGHTSELPAPGHYLTAELGQESAIIVRGQDGTLRALANVCRHRGSRVCVKQHGQATVLTCPYHAWTYDLDGSLRSAREMPEGFAPAEHGLAALPIAIIGGLIFISFAPHPPCLDAAAEALASMTRRYAWPSARIAARRTYSVRANWKLAMENYHECYHCGPAHPEFAELHALARPGNRRIAGQDAEAWGPLSGAGEVFRVMHSQLADHARTGSRTGEWLAPLMADAAPLGQCVFAELGFLSAFLAYQDHGVIYRFIPRAVLDTDMELIWLVRGDAEPDRDYDPDALTWLWDVTSQADKRIIERNQAGVLSRFYRPGPFSLMEPGTRQYVERYVAELAHRETTHGL